MSSRNLLLYLALFLLLAGCRNRDKTPDVSHISVDVNIDRFDQAFMNLDTLHMKEVLHGLEEKYPVFLPVYLRNIMNFEYDPEKDPDPFIKQFIEGEDIRELQKIVDEKYDDRQMEGLKKDFEQGFRYVKYYFPDFQVPKIITFISALSNYGAITVDSLLGIGLDMFLGADFTLYKKMADPYPDYILKRFTKKNILISSFKVLATNRYPLPERGTLLDQMIAEGKVLYFLDKVLPEVSDPDKINYSEEEYQWCLDNEQYIWQYFIKNDLLYNKNQSILSSYIGAGPSSRGMPPEAPGDIGSWVGWQIVRKYAEKHSEKTLKEIMEEKEASRLLTESNYHPH